MSMKSGLAVLACAAITAISATPAFAGESTGNFERTGKTTPISKFVASSICSFSGQNPEAFLPPTDLDYEPGRTQSWGQIPHAVRSAPNFPAELHPGNSCNGHTGFLAGGGGE